MSTSAPFEREALRIRETYLHRDAERDRRLYSYFDPGNRFIIQEREHRLLDLLGRHGFTNLGDTQFLEIGCGSGFWIRAFIQWGIRPENVVGVDLQSRLIGEARRLCPPAVRLECRNAVQLDLPGNSFDLVMQSMAFSSILHGETRNAVAREMLRVVRKSGSIIWYDFFVDNPANRNVKSVRKAEIQRLFPGCKVFLERVTPAPPLTRRLAGFAWNLCWALAALRVLDTHWLALIRKN